LRNLCCNHLSEDARSALEHKRMVPAPDP
jgi:hypothetical protein